MKYSDHPMPLTDGEYPWEREQYLVDGVWKERWVQLEDEDIPPEVGPTDYGEYSVDEYNEEYYAQRTFCKSCGVEFIAYSPQPTPALVRNYCPGCGKRLEEGDK